MPQQRIPGQKVLIKKTMFFLTCWSLRTRNGEAVFAFMQTVIANLGLLEIYAQGYRIHILYTLYWAMKGLCTGQQNYQEKFTSE